jgi:hypothetical protein
MRWAEHLSNRRSVGSLACRSHARAQRTAAYWEYWIIEP